MNAPWEPPMAEDEEVGRLRVPPHSVEAEQSVLGGLLLDNAAWDRAGDLLTEGDFYRHENRLVFAAIAALATASKPADVVTVFEHLQRVGKAADAGGVAYLNALAQSVPSAGNMRRWAEIVRERSLLRQLIAALDNGATAAFNPQGKSALQVLDEVATAVQQLDRGQLRKAPRRIGELVAGRLDRVSALERGELKGGYSTGLPRLDRALNGGLRPGNVYVLAARPSVGKSSFAQHIGLDVSRVEGPVLMLSQEMAEGEVVDRALSSLGEVDYTGIQTGRFPTNDGWSALTAAVELARDLPFYVDDQPALRLRDIRGKARQVKGLKLLIVDYLQLSVGEGDNRVQEIGSLSRGIKALAKDMDVPVLLLSQLNRKVDERPSKEPVMSDLRDSGEIEQDADVVMFLWPAGELESGSRLVGFKLGKNRQGSPDVRFGLDFYGAHQRWRESTKLLPSGAGAVGRTHSGGFDG